MLCSHLAISQNLTNPVNLPDAPMPAGQAAQAGQPPVQAQGTARISGVLVDDHGDSVNAATVTLSAPGILGERSTTSDTEGRFAFAGLAPGQYRLMVSAQNFAAYTSGVLTVAAGQAIVAPQITLRIATTTAIDVIATPDQIAVAQVHEEEKQRVFAVFPNFYTSYIWDAAPMPAREKYQMATRALIDPVQFLTVAGTAGAEQMSGTYSEYGPGIQGYGKRYAATLATATSSRMLGSAIFPVLFRQDPRYFYQGSGGAGSRALHAIGSTFITRGDNGKNQPNFAHLLGSLSASAIASAYLPASDRSAGVVFQTFGIDVGGIIAGNLFREFVLRGLVPSVPSFANGKRSASPLPQPSAPPPGENPTPQR